MRQYAAVLLLSVIPVLFNISCKNNPAEPVLPEPGRRDYVWTVDTLYPGSGIYFIGDHLYGETPDDIWAVGAGVGVEDIWHYDGKKWKEADLGVYKLNNILGFSKKDIWVCGNVSFWHYNGFRWERYPNVIPLGSTNVTYTAMAGTGSDNIYATGTSFERDGHTPKSSVARFNGSEWTSLNIKNIPPGQFVDIKFEKATGKYYILCCYVKDTSQTYSVYILQGTSVREVFSTKNIMTINSINGECYFSTGGKIYKYRDNRMQLWEDFSGTNYFAWLWGRNECDLFTLNHDALGHYNGRDLVDVFKTDLWIRSGVFFTNEVFFLCMHPESNCSFVIHGQIK